MTRRAFVALGAATALAFRLPSPVTAGTVNDVPYRALGKTGVRISMVGVGGAHIGQPSVSENEAIRIIREALDAGINFLDNCWDYNDDKSEDRMGKALRDGYRDKAFLMTKIDGRDRITAARQIDESLRRLQTDHIDLMQVHEVIRPNDPPRVFASGGALEALSEAKKAGKIKFIGFTGHKSPTIHLKMLETASQHGFHFDTVQMPINLMDAHYDSFTQRVLPLLVRRQIGVLGMKPMGAGIILESKTVSATECLRYAMSLPTSVVITGITSMKELRQALGVVRGFQPMAQAEMAALLARTAAVAHQGEYEKYKTSHRFDGTHQHPEWLGPGGEA